MPHHHHDGGAAPQQPQPESPKPNPKVLSLILKATIMTFVTSFFFLLLGLASLLLLPLLLATHHHHHHHHHQQPNCSNGFSPKHLKKLPQFRYVKGTTNTVNAQQETDECVVCLDGFKGGQWCRKLVGCGHVFHRKCVDTWLLKVSACPICRTRVPFDLEEDKDIRVFGTRSNPFRVW